MKKAIIPLALTVFFSTFGYAQTLIYSWRDSVGKVHIVDEINKVPDQYRKDLKVYRLSSPRGTQKPRSEPPPKDRYEDEGSGGGGFEGGAAREGDGGDQELDS